jgi:hypothetical protein
MFNLAVDISDATKWASMGSLNIIANRTTTPIRYRGRYLDHYPISDKDLGLIFDNHILLIKAFSNEPDKNYRFCGYLSFFARTSGGSYDSRFYSQGLSFGETLIVVPRVGADFTVRLQSIKYWLQAFSIQIFQYDDEALTIDESQLLLLESSIVQMSATLDSISERV